MRPCISVGFLPNSPSIQGHRNVFSYKPRHLSLSMLDWFQSENISPVLPSRSLYFLLRPSW